MPSGAYQAAQCGHKSTASSTASAPHPHLTHVSHFVSLGMNASPRALRRGSCRAARRARRAWAATRARRVGARATPACRSGRTGSSPTSWARRTTGARHRLREGDEATRRDAVARRRGGSGQAWRGGARGYGGASSPHDRAEAPRRDGTAISRTARPNTVDSHTAQGVSI